MLCARNVRMSLVSRGRQISSDLKQNSSVVLSVDTLVRKVNSRGYQSHERTKEAIDTDQYRIYSRTTRYTDIHSRMDRIRYRIHNVDYHCKIGTIHSGNAYEMS